MSKPLCRLGTCPPDTTFIISADRLQESVLNGVAERIENKMVDLSRELGQPIKQKD